MLGLGDMLVEDTWKEASQYYNEKLRKLQEEKDEQIAAMEKERNTAEMARTAAEKERNERLRISILRLNQAGHDSEFIASVLQMSEPEVNEILQMSKRTKSEI